MSKRKGDHADASRRKTAKIQSAVAPIHCDLLDLFYPSCTSLRNYLLASLPQSSRLRRRKIKSLGKTSECDSIEGEVSHLLDSTLVCFHQLKSDTSDNTWEQWLSFSQRADDSAVTISGNSPTYSQSEIVDFVIWLLFSRDNSGAFGPKHLLCDGYRRNATEKTQAELIPGVFSRYHNDQVAYLKESPWPQVLALLGQSGQKIMINLLVDCSIFVAVQPGCNNFYQISGNPMSELDHELGKKKSVSGAMKLRSLSDITLVRSRMFYSRPPMTSKGHIQPGYRHIHALNRFSYTPETVLSKGISQKKNDLHTAKVMMYIFPRQFGLHNVFTSTVDLKTTVQKFQDYTVRDEEIARYVQTHGKVLEHGAPKIPKRLRGAARDLVRRLQILHRRCSYFELIRHYCPSIVESLRSKAAKDKAPTANSRSAPCQPGDQRPPTGPSGGAKPLTRTQNRTLSSRIFQLDPSTPIVELATPVSKVSAFLQAALSRIIPNAFWGTGEDLAHNRALLGKKVHHFVTLRRFESINLHELSQGFKTSKVDWLHLPGQDDRKPSQEETRKRLEIFHEFLYYVFDSLLIPLARNTFYVTESNGHRYQVFYFRHDVWKMVSDRAMSAIRDGMLEELKVSDVQHRLNSRRLGFSQIRLLPKGPTVRPIMNLRRRYPTKHNKKILGPSINAILTPLYNVLKLEKDLNPSNLGATIFCVGDIYERVKAFKSQLPSPVPRLYFVKADVQSAFDTIPQDAVLRLLMSIPSHPSYKIFKHAGITGGQRAFSATATGIGGTSNPLPPSQPPPKPVRHWHRAAYPSNESPRFLERLERSSGAARRRKNTVFVNSAAHGHYDTRELLHLLAEHVSDNHVKVGKKLYRQRRGIPQGSVLSSFLCNYFYADLEAKHLGFLKDVDDGESGTGRSRWRSSLLLRLVDDFLLITTDKSKAQRFAGVLHRGVPEYGVQVNYKKSLANFSLSVRVAEDKNEEGGGSREEHVQLDRVDSGAGFPYCGILINCNTLNISKDCEREKQIEVSNTLTVEHGRVPGQNFERKVLNTFKIQSHLMFYDTSHNSNKTVLATLRAAFRQCALKMWAYMRSLHRASRPRPDLVKRTIVRTIEASYLILTSKFRKMKHQGYECAIRRSQVALLAYDAFEEVLRTKQAQYSEVLAWLREKASNA